MGKSILIEKRERRTSLRLPALLLILGLPFSAFSNIVNVPDDYPTILEAINHAMNGDTVLVAPGTYRGISYTGTNESPAYLTLMGSGWPNGTVVIGCPDAEEFNAFEIVRVQGWRITNFEITACGDAINANKVTKLEIDHNYMHGMKMAYWSCAVEGDSMSGVSIHHNLAADIVFAGFMLWGGNGDQTGLHVYNNTLDNIYSYEGIQFREGNPQYCVVTNNIITHCGGQGVEFAYCSQGNTVISYNCIFETNGPWQNVTHPGPGNIFRSPQYLLEASIPEYYFLDDHSPCIDTGNPNPFYNDPDSSRSDMGAFPSGYTTVELDIAWVNALPGNLVDVPITISDVSNLEVLSTEFTITYPDEDLELIRVSLPDSSLPYQAGWALNYTNPAGLIVATIEGETPLSGRGVLAVMSFELGENVLPDSVWNILFLSASLNNGALTPQTVNGGVRLPSEILFGDVNLNGQVTLSDVSLLFDYLTGAEELDPMQQFVTEVSGLMGITAFDGALITQYCYHQFPLFPVEGGVVETYTEGSLSIPELTAVAGDEVVIPVNVQNGINVASAQMSMTLGGEVVELTEIIGPGQGAWFSRYSGSYPDFELYLGGNEAVNGNQGLLSLMFQIPDSASGSFSLELTGIMLNETEMPQQVYREIIIHPASVSGENSVIPNSFSFAPAYPNPFNPTTNLVFEIPHASPVSLTLYNSLGQIVQVLESGTFQAGRYTAIWDASSFSSGIYLAELIAGENRQYQKLLLLK